MIKEDKLLNTHPLQTPQWAEFRREWGNEVAVTEYGVLTLHKIPYTKYKVGMFIKGARPTPGILLCLPYINHRLLYHQSSGHEWMWCAVKRIFSRLSWSRDNC